MVNFGLENIKEQPHKLAIILSRNEASMGQYFSRNFRKSVRSMPKRLRTVIQSKGGNNNK